MHIILHMHRHGHKFTFIKLSHTSFIGNSYEELKFVLDGRSFLAALRKTGPISILLNLSLCGFQYRPNSSKYWERPTWKLLGQGTLAKKRGINESEPLSSTHQQFSHVINLLPRQNWTKLKEISIRQDGSKRSTFLRANISGFLTQLEGLLA